MKTIVTNTTGVTQSSDDAITTADHEAVGSGTSRCS
jgi:hypothetical protein